MTPNHRNWVRYRSDNYDDIEAGWRIERAYVTAANTNRKWFRTAASSWVGHRLKPAFLASTCKLRDFAAFVGWWTAEGWLGDRKLDCVQICQSVKNEAKCKEIDRVVRSLGLRFSVGDYLRKTSKSEGLVRQWSIRSSVLAKWLTKNVGRGASKKKLSSKVRDWDTPYLKAFFIAYMDGDGTRRYQPRRNNGGITHKNHTNLLDHHQNAHTVSSCLAGDLQEIACKLGITARLKWRPGDETEPRLPLCRVKMAGSRFVVMEGKKSCQVVKYSGQVHCVSVPNSIIYVRRDGKPFFSGNSMQRKLLSTTVDQVGRAVITPDVNLDMDELAIPEDAAWDLYKPHIVRRLRRKGMSMLEASAKFKARDKQAKQELLDEMRVRPVVTNRAPVLHRFGVMAFKPRLTKGSTMKLSPLIVKGFNADFDGDAMQFHVPMTDAAIRDGYERMLPSRNLISPADLKSPVHSLVNEFAAGLYHASTAKESKRRPRVFTSREDVLKALARNELDPQDPIEIVEPK